MTAFDKAWDISKNTCRRCSSPRMSNSSYCSDACKRADEKEYVYSGGISKILWNDVNFPDYRLVLQQFFVQSLGYRKITTMTSAKNIIFKERRNFHYHVISLE